MSGLRARRRLAGRRRSVEVRGLREADLADGGNDLRPHADAADGLVHGLKVLAGIAVERTEPKGFGRCRMAPLVDASGDSLGGSTEIGPRVAP